MPLYVKLINHSLGTSSYCIQGQPAGAVELLEREVACYSCGSPR